MSSRFDNVHTQQLTYRMNAGNFPSQMSPKWWTSAHSSNVSASAKWTWDFSGFHNMGDRAQWQRSRCRHKKQRYKSPRQHASGAVIRLRLLSIFSNSMCLITVNKLLSCTVYSMSKALSRVRRSIMSPLLAISPKHVHKCVYQNRVYPIYEMYVCTKFPLVVGQTISNAHSGNMCTVFCLTFGRPGSAHARRAPRESS